MRISGAFSFRLRLAHRVRRERRRRRSIFASAAAKHTRSRMCERASPALTITRSLAGCTLSRASVCDANLIYIGYDAGGVPWLWLHPVLQHSDADKPHRVQHTNRLQRSISCCFCFCCCCAAIFNLVSRVQLISFAPCTRPDLLNWMRWCKRNTLWKFDVDKNALL
jgi:hypothetical protein